MNHRRRHRMFSNVVLGGMMAIGLGTAVADEASLGRATPYFRIQSESGKNARGATRVTGYVYNDSGSYINNVQLLVESVDDAGQVIAKRVTPIVGAVAPLNRGYFDVPAPGAAASYRVTVYSFNWVGCSGGA